MCSKTWAKWLSGIALVMSAFSVIGTLVESKMIAFTETGLLLATVVLVIMAFSKDKAKKK